MLLDAKTGKPISGISLNVSAWTADTPYVVSGEKPMAFFGKTDSAGRFVVRLLDPLPRFVGLHYTPFDLHGCSERTFLATEALESGFVARYTCGSPSWKAIAKAEPGKIIVFERRMSFWDRLKLESP